MSFLLGEPTSINSEPLVEDLFALKARFEALGLIVKDGDGDLEDVENLHIGV